MELFIGDSYEGMFLDLVTYYLRLGEEGLVNVIKLS
jgi:hypothetical protein